MTVLLTIHHCHLFPTVLAALFAVLICSTAPLDTAGLFILPQCSAGAESRVTVEKSSPLNETIYRISYGDCKIEWIVRNTEVGVIQYRAHCSVSLSQQLPILTKICAEFFTGDRNAQAFHTLFWGRLTPDETKPGLQEMSLRLALAAYKSADWNTKTGKPKNGDVNGFVRDLANGELIYPELKELFEHFNKSIRFSCAEKVLVLEAGKLPYYDQLEQYGIKETDKLPFDCMTWFSVSPAAQK
jgi:hypothetical protein